MGSTDGVFEEGGRDFRRANGTNLWRQSIPPPRAHGIHASAVSSQHAVQREPPSSLGLGARAASRRRTRRRSGVVTGCGGASCKIAVHVDGCRRPVVHALRPRLPHQPQYSNHSPVTIPPSASPHLVHIQMLSPLCFGTRASGSRQPQQHSVLSPQFSFLCGGLIERLTAPLRLPS